VDPHAASQPAWPHGDGPFTDDFAHQTVAAGGHVYFGSSADHHVYCLSADTGEIRWSFLTGAPIRFAPQVYEGRLYVASDDGVLYCLNAANGKPIWKFVAGPEGAKRSMLLGNGRMVSRWPLRTGLVVDNGVVYFTAGVWGMVDATQKQKKGIGDPKCFYALSARDGTVVWKRERRGGSPLQGCMAASPDALLVPQCRTEPAFHERGTGKPMPAERGGGGAVWAVHKIVVLRDTWTMIARGRYFISNPPNRYDVYTPSLTCRRLPRKGEKSILPAVRLCGALRIVVGDGAFYVIRARKKRHRRPRRTTVHGAVGAYAWGSLEEAFAHQQREYEKKKKMPGGYYFFSKKKPAPRWSFQCPGPLYTVILAGKTLYVGGDRKVVALDAAGGGVLWEGEIDGKALGLAVAEGRLLVSSDTGRIHCFAGQRVDARETGPPAARTAPFGDNAACAAFADRVVKETGVTDGYCLDFGCGDGRLACELARRTKLRIYAVDSDAGKVAAARQALTAAGLYGARVTVHRVEPGTLPYPGYFADLIVSGNGFADLDEVKARAFYRCLRPHGGVAYLAGPGTTCNPFGGIKPKDPADPQVAIRVGEGVTRIIRGPLPGAGDWFSQKGNGGNASNSGGRFLRPPFKVHWYGGPGPQRSTGIAMQTEEYPVAAGGRVYYPARRLRSPRHGPGSALASWKATLPNGKVPVKLRPAELTIAVDAYTGRTLWERDLPGKLYADGGSCYVAVPPGTGALHRLDGRTGETVRVYEQAFWKDLMLSCGDVVITTRDRKSVCALGKGDGKTRWRHPTKETLKKVLIPYNDRSSQHPVALGRGRLYALEPDGGLVALEAETGKVVWRTKEGLKGDEVSVHSHDNVVLCGSGVKRRNSGLARMGLIAFAAEDGRLLWTNPRVTYDPRSLLVAGGLIFVDRTPIELRTGKQSRKFKRGPRKDHRCGGFTATSSVVFYSSGGIGTYDTETGRAVTLPGPRRCCGWTHNTLPSSGLAVYAFMGTDCGCARAYWNWVALSGRELDELPFVLGGR
jgi:outer membrane protein assembly factor BamB